ncbi:hypothetical protein E2562_002627 [Oryza meyeriana var. granulata]|uniref:Uncharacterized protein n=1 Tax=Oryza meyeriana var. granulata TaxID=110450 RepID=A0A6G1F306_9ORYZ|nr:hypothetical protein E2562_002627 [Oryza meyeriana var. granulata]
MLRTATTAETDATWRLARRRQQSLEQVIMEATGSVSAREEGGASPSSSGFREVAAAGPERYGSCIGKPTKWRIRRWALRAADLVTMGLGAADLAMVSTGISGRTVAWRRRRPRLRDGREAGSAASLP